MLFVLGVSEEHSSAVTVDLKDVQTNVVMLHCDNIRVNAKKLCQRLSSVSIDFCFVLCLITFFATVLTF